MGNRNDPTLLLISIFSLGIVSFSAFYICETLKLKTFLSEICHILPGKISLCFFGAWLQFCKGDVFYRLQFTRLFENISFPGNSGPQKVLILTCLSSSYLSFAIEKVVWNMQLIRIARNLKTFKYYDDDKKTSYHIIARDKKSAQEISDNAIFKREVKYLIENGFWRIDVTEKAIRIFKYNYRLDELSIDVISNYLDHLVKIREAFIPK